MRGFPISPRRSTCRTCSKTWTACWSGRSSGLLRIQKIVADLRDFAHLDEADFKEADLNAGISTTVTPDADVRRRTSGDTRDEPGLDPRTNCFPAKINLVVQSLISNAIDACPAGGRVVDRDARSRRRNRDPGR